MPGLVQHFIPSDHGQLMACCYDGGCSRFPVLRRDCEPHHSWAVEGDWWQWSSFILIQKCRQHPGRPSESMGRDYQVSRQGRRPLCSYPPGSLLVHAGGRMLVLYAWICSPWSRGVGASVILRTWSLTIHCSSTCTSPGRRWVPGDETPRTLLTPRVNLCHPSCAVSGGT